MASRATNPTSDTRVIPESRPLAQADLEARFPEVRRQSERLCEGLSAEDCALQSMADASPLKWHLAHTTWFFETFILDRHAAGYRAFRPQFRYLYNSYYNAVGEQYPRAQRGLISRPGLDEVRAYRSHVNDALQRMLAGEVLPAGALALIELGLNHEQQHQELMLTDFKHLLSLNPLAPAYRAPVAPPASTAPPLAWTAFEGGLVEIGHDGTGFAFDNETPRHKQYLAPFELASRPVSNGEYLAFVEDGGYRRPEFWLSDGWAIAGAQRWEAPIYWRRADGAWREFTLHGLEALDPARPVAHLSQFEADAYAHWASRLHGATRLPTECEWEAAAAGVPLAGRFAESGRLHPQPSPAGKLAALFGDVWEWTSSAYSPYPGFRAAAGAVGEYNGKFMSNQYVLRGGSCATPCSHMRASYRNFFPSHARWQFSGLRLARDPG